MKKYRFIFVFISVFALAVLISSCAPQAAPTEPPPPPVTLAPTMAPVTMPSATSPAGIPVTSGSDLKGNLVRGAKLYDSWWLEIAATVPTDDMPLFKTQTTDKAKGANTWKCNECHGYDYKGVDGVYAKGSHMTGFKGVLASKGKDPAVLLDALKGKTNPLHDFSTVMEEQDLVDLALFVSKGVFDMDAVLNPDGSPKGVAADGKEKFGQVCATCHGPNGNAINFKTPGSVEYLAHVTNSNPWQALHRTTFGVTEWPMPAAAENNLSPQDVSNILAYARALPKDGAIASGGGKLFDKWYTELAVNTPDGDQPLWKTQTTNTRKGVSTWTCRECHGLDYLGVDGMYATGAHATGFPGIFAAASKSEQDLTNALNGKTDPNHDFSKVLNDAQISSIVHWMKNEMFDISKFVNADGVTVKGDKDHGKTIYSHVCTECHGDDGKLLNFKTPDAPEYVGTVASAQPQDCMHRVAFGVPGFPMSAALDLGLSLQDIADACAYSGTLPVK